MEQIKNPRIIVLLVLYITSLIASNTLGLKLMPFIFGTHLSVAVFFFPFVFLTTDIIGQVYGKKLAKTFVWAGFLATLLFLVFNIISNIMPWSDSALWVKDSFNTVFSISVRISIASLLAFVIGEYQDVLTFFFFKDKLPSFFLRSTISNIWSQLIDTAIFMTIAFAGIYSPKVILLMSIPWWLYKVGMGVLYTPLSYIGINYLNSYENTNDQN